MVAFGMWHAAAPLHDKAELIGLDGCPLVGTCVAALPTHTQHHLHLSQQALAHVAQQADQVHHLDRNLCVWGGGSRHQHTGPVEQE
jgi:hypothetical protein